MLIYFDESYDNDKKWLLLWAWFHPHSTYLHRRISEIKKNHNFSYPDGTPKEIKYNKCINQKNLTVCKEVIDAFFESTSYFRLIAIEQGAEWFDLDRFGNAWENDYMKFARMYKKFAELLVKHNTDNLYNWVLLTDELTRPKTDIFFTLMEELFCNPGKNHSGGKKEPTLKEIKEVSSHLEQYQVLQVTDLLMWCVLNHLKPTVNPFKTEIANYLASKVWSNFKKEDWVEYSKPYCETYWPKFNIWFWSPPIPKNNTKKDSGWL